MYGLKAYHFYTVKIENIHYIIHKERMIHKLYNKVYLHLLLFLNPKQKQQFKERL